MATIEELTVEIKASDVGATDQLEKLEGQLDSLQKSSRASTKKTLDLASQGAQKTGKELEATQKKAVKATTDIGESGKKTLEVFSSLKKQLIGFIGAAALFSFGKNLVTDVVKTNLALGELSRTTNRNVKDVQGLQQAWINAGKSGDLASQHLAEWSKATSEYETSGRFDHRFNQAAALLGGGIQFRNQDGSFREYEDVLFDLGEKAKAKFGKDAARKLQGMGLTADEADVATHQTRDMVKALQAQSSASEEAIAKSEELNRQYQELVQSCETLKQEIFLKLQPIIKGFLEWLQELADELAKDPDLIKEVIFYVSALAVAFGLIFNPIGTTIALFVGLFAILKKATHNFDAVRRTWNGMVLAIKEGINAVIPLLASFLRAIGATDMADSLDRFRFDTSAETAAVSAPEPTDDGKSIFDGFKKDNGNYAGYGGGYDRPYTGTWSGGSVSDDAWARANVQGESGNTNGVGRDGKPLKNLNKGSRFGRYAGTYDVGKYQLNETNGPAAAKMAGLPWDRNRFFNDVNYANRLGEAFMVNTKRKADRLFGGDPAKAFAYYHSPKAMVEANKYGSNWLEYLRRRYPLVYQSTVRKMRNLGSNQARSPSRVPQPYPKNAKPVPQYSAGAGTRFNNRGDSSVNNTTNNYNYTFNGVKDAVDAGKKARQHNQSLESRTQRVSRASAARL